MRVTSWGGCGFVGRPHGRGYSCAPYARPSQAPHPLHTPIWGTHPVRGPTASIGGNMALFSGDSRVFGVAREMAWSNVSLDSGRALRV